MPEASIQSSLARQGREAGNPFLDEAPGAFKAEDASKQMERPLVFNPLCGTHIDSACQEAVALAISKNREVAFKFNDVELSATKWSNPETIAKAYDAITERRRAEYWASPEGIASAKARKEAVEGKQRAVDGLLRELPTVLKTGKLDKAMKWLQSFQPPSDDVDVKFNHTGIVSTFMMFGYAENENVGHPSEWFNTRERMGRYVIGQAINCLKHGMPPHGRTLHFCKEYFKLGTKRKATSVGRGGKQGAAPVNPKPEKADSEEIDAERLRAVIEGQ